MSDLDPREVLTTLNERVLLPRVGLSYMREMDKDILAIRDAATAMTGLLAAVEQATQAIDAVRALHVGHGWMNPARGDDRRTCSECGENWPCATVRALPDIPGPEVFPL